MTQTDGQGQVLSHICRGQLVRSTLRPVGINISGLQIYKKSIQKTQNAECPC